MKHLFLRREGLGESKSTIVMTSLTRSITWPGAHRTFHHCTAIHYGDCLLQHLFSQFVK